ncbi:MAG: hypothetical protein IJ446_07345 [Oscillospiraceae bacterium]|nr:hypothetical protein [Oscillospiraceae bacterium]
MNFKKLSAAAAALLMLSGMTACGSSSESGSDEKIETVVITEPPVSETSSDTSAETEAVSESVVSSETESETSSESTEEIVTEETSAEAEPVSETVPETSAENNTGAEAVSGGYYSSSETPVSFDLDMDGTDEIIEYVISPDDTEGEYYLSVNDIQFNLYDIWPYYAPIDRICICDMDTSDNYHEIAVSTSGPSVDYSTAFFRYDSNGLTYMGEVGDTIAGDMEYEMSIVDQNGESLTVNGDGTVTAAKRLDIFQTWFAYTTYEYSNEAGCFIELADFLYYPYGEDRMNDYESVSTQISESWEISSSREPINIYSEMSFECEPVVFEPQKFVATATDNITWVYIVGESGASGWIYCDDSTYFNYIDSVTGESLEMPFDNLQMYD